MQRLKITHGRNGIGVGRRRKTREHEIVRAKVQEKLKMKVQCGGGKDGKKKGGRDGERGKELSLYTLTVGVELHNAPQLGSNQRRNMPKNLQLQAHIYLGLETETYAHPYTLGHGECPVP